MAGKSEDKAENGRSGGGLMRVIVKACFVLGLISALILFLAAIDFQVFDLGHVLGLPALGALGLFVISASLGGIAAMLSGNAVLSNAGSAYDEMAAKLQARIKAVEEKFGAHLDAEINALKKERDGLQGELDTVHAAEEEKRLAEEKRKEEEFELLKQQNRALQEQLREISLNMKSANAPAAEEPAAQAQAG